MCGHKGWTSIATWARSQPALAKAPVGHIRKHPVKSSRFDRLSQRSRYGWQTMRATHP